MDLFGSRLNTSPIDPRVIEEANRRMQRQVMIDTSPVGQVRAVGDTTFVGGVPIQPQAQRGGLSLQGMLDVASMAPGIGDFIGPLNDAQRLYRNPEERTPLNFGLAAAGALPFVPSGLGMVAGRMAKTADLNALSRAEDLARQGVPREQIWSETGWWKGVDDKWRFEIDDSNARFTRFAAEDALKRQQASSGIGARRYRPTLGEAVDHPLAEQAYPGMGGMEASFAGGPGGHYRRATPDDPEMVRIGLENQDPRSVALHEMQHGVQAREGFAPGGSPSQLIDFPAARSQMRSLNDQLTLLNEQTGFADWVAENWKNRPEGATLESMRDTFFSQQDLGVRQHYKMVRDMQEQTRAMYPELSKLPDMFTEDDVYNRLAGESEARAVQARRDMTAAQRKARPFWEDFDVPESEQVILRR